MMHESRRKAKFFTIPEVCEIACDCWCRIRDRPI